GKCDEPDASHVLPSVRGTSFWECPLSITARLAADGRVGFMSRPGPWAEVRFATKHVQRRTRTSPHVQSAHALGAQVRGRGCFRFSFARLPFGEWKDVGNFTALVSPGIDRPEFVGLAILDHRRVVRALGD